MGKLIVFWTPFAGRCGCTASMGAVVTAMALRYPELEMAICHMQMGSMELINRLESRTVKPENREAYERMGLNALALNYMQSELTAEKIKRCAVQLRLKSLYLYPAVGKKENIEEIYDALLNEKLKEEFDMVFVDLEAGRTARSLGYLKKAEVIVLVLPQDDFCWQLYEEEYKKEMEGKEVCIVLGKYRCDSRFTQSYFKKKQHRAGGKIIGTVPECTGYMDAMAEGRTLEFFLKNQMVGKKETNYEFMEQTRQSAEKLKQYMDEQGQKLRFF